MPTWAIHIPRRELDRDARLDRLQGQLIAELGRKFGPRGTTPPEQIAAMAIHELEAGNPWDAAVLLALASYRRMEQADYIVEYARDMGLVDALASTRGQVDREKYAQFVKLEEESFRGAVFDDDLERVAASLGAAQRDASIHEDWMRIAMGNLNDRYSAERTLGDRMKRLKQPQRERVAHPGLALAFLQHLEEETRTPKLYPLAMHYLELVPLQKFRVAALRHVRSPFDAAVLRAGVILHAQDPEAIASALSDENPSTRGHAAMIFGLTGDLARLPALEQTLAAEREPLVQRMFEFALVHLGEHQHLPQLIQRTDSQEQMAAVQAVSLLQWMPADLKATVPQVVFVDAIERKGAAEISVFLAAMTLCDIGRVKLLEPDARRALFDAVSIIERSKDRWAERGAEHLSDAIAKLEQLDRPRVLQAIRRREQPLRPWLARFSKLSQESDLGLLDQLIAATDKPAERGWLIAAVAHIRGPKAQGELEAWFDRYEALDVVIALHLVLRLDVDKRRLFALRDALADRPSTTFFDLALGHPAAAARLSAYLHGDDPQHRYIAAMAIKLFGGPESRPALWLNAGYEDDRFYPQDVKLRHMALSALVDVGLNRTQRRALPRGKLGPAMSPNLQSLGVR